MVQMTANLSAVATFAYSKVARHRYPEDSVMELESATLAKRWRTGCSQMPGCLPSGQWKSGLNGVSIRLRL